MGESPADTRRIRLALPQIQAGMAAGLYGPDHVLFVFDRGDRNGDSLGCYMSTGNGDQLRSMYAVNMVDNNAAPT